MALLFRRIRDKQRHMLRSLASSLIEHGSVTTTTANAKAVKPLVERWITVARKTTLATGAERLAKHRMLIAEIHHTSVVNQLLKNVVPRIGNRAGGYTRMYKLSNRHGDAAPQSMITFVDAAKPVDDKKVEAATKKTTSPKKAVAKASV